MNIISKITREKDNLGRRHAIFLIGLFICSFGVACTTKAGLGTTPTVSIPYTLSLIFTDLSFGNWLIIFSMLQIIAQIIMLRKRTVVSEIVIQVVLTFAYGYLTDFSFSILKGLEVNSYILKIIFLLIGCVIIAFGVYLELLGNVGMLSGDAFIKAIATITNKEYGNVKIITDVSMSVISATLAVAVLHRLAGVREGTIIAALMIGIIIKYFKKILKPVIDQILPNATG